MEHIFNPDDDEVLKTWFEQIGAATGNMDNWTLFANSIVVASAASTIGLLRKLRSSDVEGARMQASLAEGYSAALKTYLVPQGATPFEFALPITAKVKRDRASKEKRVLFQKKYRSQQDRTTLGRELGQAGLAALAFPQQLFAGINHCKEKPMKTKGKNSAAEVADRVLCWAISKWGNLHVDALFCERVEELLLEKFPHLKNWGKSQRRWSEIIANRFSNLREAKDGLYQHLKLSTKDLSSPIKKLIMEENLPITIDEGCPSLFCESSPAKGIPVRLFQVEQGVEPTVVPDGTTVPELHELPPAMAARNDPASINKPRQATGVVAGARVIAADGARVIADSSSDDDEQNRPQHRALAAARKRAAVGELDPPDVQKKKKTFAQKQLEPKISLRECKEGDPLITAKPAAPALTADNAAGRFVFTKGAVFGCNDVPGWTGRIMHVAKDKQETTKIKYHDQIKYFKFAFVAENFKPLT